MFKGVKTTIEPRKSTNPTKTASPSKAAAAAATASTAKRESSSAASSPARPTSSERKPPAATSSPNPKPSPQSRTSPRRQPSLSASTSVEVTPFKRRLVVDDADEDEPVQRANAVPPVTSAYFETKKPRIEEQPVPERKSTKLLRVSGFDDALEIVDKNPPPPTRMIEDDFAPAAARRSVPPPAAVAKPATAKPSDQSSSKSTGVVDVDAEPSSSSSKSGEWQPYKKSAYGRSAAAPHKPAAAAAAAAAPASPAKKTTPASPAKRAAASPQKKRDDHKAGSATDEEDTRSDAEKERDRRAHYMKMLNRTGPTAIGTKEIPTGATNCLEGLTFVVTGIFDAIDRTDLENLIKAHGGKVTGAVSKKTTYLVAGRDCGISKTRTAKEVGTKIVDDDAVFDLIRTLPAKNTVETSSMMAAAAKQAKKMAASEAAAPKASASSSSAFASSSSSSSSSSRHVPASSAASTSSAASATAGSDGRPAASLLAEKYRPTATKEIFGNKLNVERLKNWLMAWESNNLDPVARAANKEQLKEAKKGFKKSKAEADGSEFKAALLSGPPGIGKTTAAHIVARECGFEPIEFNASDVRSKKALRSVVSESMGSHSMAEYFGGRPKSSQASANGGERQVKHVLIMDEVDGMSSGDLGGVGELNLLIRSAMVPVICICNDRFNRKLRTLGENCYDLKFDRPTPLQITGRLLSVAAREGIQLDPAAASHLAQATNSDIRQCLNLLSLWRRNGNVKISGASAMEEMKNATKDMTVNTFDAARQLLSAPPAAAPSANGAKLDPLYDLFFVDHELMPLFVQSNYLGITPQKSRGDPVRELDLMAEAADSISQSDLVGTAIRKKQLWALLQAFGTFSSVVPARLVQGGIPPFGQFTFPTYLGKTSRINGQLRALSSIQAHMRLSASGDRTATVLHYAPVLLDSLTSPLAVREQDAIPEVISRMETYCLSRDNRDVLSEIVEFNLPGRARPTIKTAVKSAFTLRFNKVAKPNPFLAAEAQYASAKGRSAMAADDDVEFIGSESGSAPSSLVEDDEPEEAKPEDNSVDVMFKKKASGGKGAAAASRKPASASKAKAR
ncbi:replication factor C subunit 1 [Capsaspora owczarzaki ATCC 30864]|nr:replication factor C subunit 1 [Capsaspora owczarzaki ATCC 30864]|eukprot:XP_004346975.2 replication factor C subunit 1 [Capsaspora owczarzaki ATCC 30864]